MSKQISLSGDKFAIVDDEDFEMLSQWKWTINNGYAARRLKRQYFPDRPPKQRDQKMHRLLMGEPDCQIDHVNQNKLDNRKENLRVCSVSQNRSNVGLKKNNKSGYKGVSFSKRGYWIMQIRCGRIHIQKRCKTKKNKHAKELHGEFAFLNKLGEK